MRREGGSWTEGEKQGEEGGEEEGAPNFGTEETLVRVSFREEAGEEEEEEEGVEKEWEVEREGFFCGGRVRGSARGRGVLR